MGNSFKVDKRQLFWGIVAGVVTVGLMGVSYRIGNDRGKKAVLGEEEVVEDINPKEVYIAVRSNCDEYDQKDEKEVRKYCSEFTEEESSFSVMQRLNEEDEDFSFAYEESEFGAFVTSINNYHPDIASEFWAFLVNGEMSMVGVSEYTVNEGDELMFRVEEVEF